MEDHPSWTVFLNLPNTEIQVVLLKSITPTSNPSATRAREIAQLLAKVQVRGFLAYKHLPQSYSDEIELGLLHNQRVNSNLSTTTGSDGSERKTNANTNNS